VDRSWNQVYVTEDRRLTYGAGTLIDLPLGGHFWGPELVVCRSTRSRISDTGQTPHGGRRLQWLVAGSRLLWATDRRHERPINNSGHALTFQRSGVQSEL